MADHITLVPGIRTVGSTQQTSIVNAKPVPIDSSYTAVSLGRGEIPSCYATEIYFKSPLFSSRNSSLQDQCNTTSSPNVNNSYVNQEQAKSPLLTPSTLASKPSMVSKGHLQMSKLLLRLSGSSQRISSRQMSPELTQDGTSTALVRPFRQQLSKLKLDSGRSTAPVSQRCSLDLSSKRNSMFKVKPHEGDTDIPLITNRQGLLESRVSNNSIDLSKVTLGDISTLLNRRSAIAQKQPIVSTVIKGMKLRSRKQADAASQEAIHREFQPTIKRNLSKPCLYQRKGSISWIGQAFAGQTSASKPSRQQ